MAAARAQRAGPVRLVLENVEALAIAIVMALVLKHFLIEAYKIPTGSMQPGIMGDLHVGISDRVLVDKSVYLLREPRRYEVVVFKNPLWQRQNYIKRLIGFGGERIALRNGDVFVTPPGGEEAIARKPDAVWRAVRKSLSPENGDAGDLARLFKIERGDAGLAGGRIAFAPGADALLRTAEAVRDDYLDGYEPEWIEKYREPAPHSSARFFYSRLGDQDVSDVEVAADVTPGADARRIVFELRESGRLHRAELAIGDGEGALATTVAEGLDPIEWEGPGGSVPLPALRRGVTTRVSLRNVDDELVVELDGDVVLRRPYRTRGVDPEQAPRTRAPLPTHVVIEAQGAFALTDVDLWRDIHYLADSQRGGSRVAVFTIPEDEFFVLGDNTQNSWDCRQWEAGSYVLPDGRTIEGNWFVPGNKGENPESNPVFDGAWIEFRNRYGQLYRFAGNAAQELPRSPVHSVPRRFLLGKALAVFWPLPPFSPSWRIQWVR